MKTLKDHVIVYDDECPMCNLYTRQFVKTGMLDKDGRTPFADVDALNVPVDKQRACNEIALVNTVNGEVTYGTQSLLKIIGHSFPVLNGLFQCKPFQQFIRPLYAFISYNRKVIVPGTPQAGNPPCVPAFNVPYRVAYLVFTWLMTSLILNAYTQLLSPLVPASHLTRELSICGGQILFQSGVAFLANKNKALAYLGNMMTVSFIGAMLLLPGLMFTAATYSAEGRLAWFMIVVGIMFFEHMRRVRLLEMPWYMSLTWVLYRVIVLWIIL